MNLAEIAQQLLLEQFAPAAVLINRKYEIFYFFGPCSHYLEFPAGEPTCDLLKMARDGLRPKLRETIHQAIRTNQNVVVPRIRIKRNGSHHLVRLIVRPIHEPKAAEGLLLITFEEELPATPFEDLESSNEEFKASNEELTAMNEELQSLNEELRIANKQLRDKIEELETTKNHLSNLLNSTIARDISESKRTQQTLRDREERLQAILTAAEDAILTLDPHGIVQSVNPAIERLFGYMAAEIIGQNVKMLIPPPDKEEHDGYAATDGKKEDKQIVGIGREVEARRKDGSIFPAELSVSEIKHLSLFTGIIRDITRQKELEREVVEIASLEQWRIGQDLHDSVGQELTALSLLAKDLAETLKTNPADPLPRIEKMIEGLHNAQHNLRDILCGLLPIPVDSEGLMAALAELAEGIQQEGKVSCVFDCPRPVSVADNLTATHLFLIAREAVHNAVKHARSKEICITLQANRGLVLCIQDDGIGIPARRPAENRGLGLRIMRNRAAIIGAKLIIEPAAPAGTVVTCVLPRENNEPRRE